MQKKLSSFVVYESSFTALVALVLGFAAILQPSNRTMIRLTLMNSDELSAIRRNSDELQDFGDISPEKKIHKSAMARLSSFWGSRTQDIICSSKSRPCPPGVDGHKIDGVHPEVCMCVCSSCLYVYMLQLCVHRRRDCMYRYYTHMWYSIDIYIYTCMQ